MNAIIVYYHMGQAFQTLIFMFTLPHTANVDMDLDKLNFERKIVNIFLPISFNICFGCSKEPSH